MAVLRAPTPTAAAELVAPKTQDCLDVLAAQAGLLRRRVGDVLDAHAQRLDRAAVRLARPDVRLREHAQRLGLLAHRLASHLPRDVTLRCARVVQAEVEFRRASGSRHLRAQADRLGSLAVRLKALDPQRVLARGYAWLIDRSGRAVTSTRQLNVGSSLQAVLADSVAGVVVTELPESSGVPVH